MQTALVRSSPSGRTDLCDEIQNAQRAMLRHLVPEMARQGLTAHQFWPLYYLGRGGETFPSQLARRLGVTAPACTTVVDQLVADGFVLRGPAADDRRRVVLTITPKGRRALEKVWHPIEGRIRSAVADLPSDEVAVAARLLRTIADRLRSDAATGSTEAAR